MSPLKSWICVLMQPGDLFEMPIVLGTILLGINTNLIDSFLLCECYVPFRVLIDLLKTLNVMFLIHNIVGLHGITILIFRISLTGV